MPIPTQRDPELTRKALRDWLAGKLPAAEDLDISELSGPAATGFSNETILFDATWTEEGEKRTEEFVLRVKPTGYTVFLESEFEAQYEVMKTLDARSDVAVPKIWWYETDPGPLGADFYAMSRVHGRTPPDTPAYHAGGWVTELSPAERETLWWSGVENMSRIHRVNIEELGFDLLLNRPHRGTPGLDQQINYYDEYFEWARAGRSIPIAEATREWIHANRPADTEVGLVWGDSRAGNMIFDDDAKCAAVLDWEMATLGPAEEDLGWWLFLDTFSSQGSGVPRLDGFPSHEETIAHYAQLLGRPLQDMHFWTVFAGYRFSVVMMRIASLVSETMGVPAEQTEEMARNNGVTRVLATLLDLPSPGELVGLDGAPLS
jgi:aminoglycoside phosphotransferase (APT) family kinase protein